MNTRSVGKGRAQRAAAEADRQVWEQEVTRLRAQLQEARADARRENWTKTRRQFKVHVAGLGLITLVIGGLIGHYGFREKPSASGSPHNPAALTWPESAGSVRDPDTESEVVAAPWPISVYVSGAVAKAQVVELPAGSLVADALDRAGGAAADADLDAINLAAPVADNQHILVPRLTDRSGSAATEPQRELLTPAAQININTASCAELEGLPYIGESKAADIVTYRIANGPFEHIEDIQNVPGIGPATYAHIRHLITIQH